MNGSVGLLTDGEFGHTILRNLDNPADRSGWVAWDIHNPLDIYFRVL
jgi:hypothetical protein